MNKKTSRIGTLLLILAMLAVLAVAVMMLGARFDLWQPIVGFRLIRTYMNTIAFVVIGLGLLGFIYQLFTKNGAGAFKTFLATLIGVALLGPMIYAKVQPPVKYPPIHDITTNTIDPPKFLILDETRIGAKNSLIYKGAEVAAQQTKAFPDILPIQSNKSTADAFADALRVGQAMGWEIIAEDPEMLRFEAIARTKVYQFADDVVVVVTEQDSGSRIDIRSVSRIGRGDRGANAMRIREFISGF